MLSCSSISHDKHDLYQDDHLSDYKEHVKEEHDAIFQHLASSQHIEVYACELQEFSQQCREYPVPEDVLFKTEDLAKGCESMPQGKFIKGHCPAENRVARCVDIIRNNHDEKSLVYQNHYYQSKDGKWNMSEVKRVCHDLEGKLSIK